MKVRDETVATKLSLSTGSRGQSCDELLDSEKKQCLGGGAEDVRGSAKEELKDLKDTPVGKDALDARGEPVPVEEGGFDDEENHPGQATRVE